MIVLLRTAWIFALLSLAITSDDQAATEQRLALELPRALTSAEAWLRASSAFANPTLQGDDIQPSTLRLAMRSAQTCLRLDDMSAPCNTQLGALLAASPSAAAEDQMAAVRRFRRAAVLQPGSRRDGLTDGRIYRRKDDRTGRWMSR